MPMGQVPLFVRARSIHQQKRVKLAVPNITLRRKSRRTTSPSDHLAVRWSVCRPTKKTRAKPLAIDCPASQVSNVTQ